MAKNISNNFLVKPKKKRKGVHSKNKSRTKGGSQYVKTHKANNGRNITTNRKIWIDFDFTSRELICFI